jgi:cytoskeletal protein RodZ
MKRCPKCEFIYEDDQSLCDMDGALLVLDSRTLPNLHNLETKTPAPKRNRAVPAFATLILALVLGLVYYVSIHRRAAQNSYTPPPPSAASTSNPAPPEVNVNPTPEMQLPAAEEPKPELPKRAAAAAVPAPVKKVAAKPEPTPARQKAEEKKEDSKVNSILKKTGRILKKPFKF